MTAFRCLFLTLTVLVCHVWSFRQNNLRNSLNMKPTLRVVRTFSPYLSNFMLKDSASVVESSNKKDMLFWDDVKSATKKIESEGKKCNDVVIIQTMMQLVAAHKSGNPLSSNVNIPSSNTPASTSASDGSASLDITSMVQEAIKRLAATSLKDMAKVMNDIKSKIDPKDIGKLSETVKKLLTEIPVSSESSTASTTTVAATDATTSAPPTPILPMEELSEEDQKLFDMIKQTIKNKEAKTMKDANKVMASVRMRVTSEVSNTKISDFTKRLLGG